METRLDPASRVRCLDCRAVYQQSAEVSDGQAGARCPKCGGAAWLAADIPLPDPVPEADV